MQARDMMCRYESRALSASDIGNKSFRFRISALIWSRRALDAPLVERYMVIGRRRRTVGVLRGQSWGVGSGVRLAAWLRSPPLGCVQTQVRGEALRSSYWTAISALCLSREWLSKAFPCSGAPAPRPALVAGRLLDPWSAGDAAAVRSPSHSH